MTIFLITSIGSLAAQSNDRLDELLSQSPARLDSTAYLIITAGALASETATASEAFDLAVSQGLIAKSRPEDPVTIEELSFLLMKTLKLPGGLEWSFLPNPRAAYRELAFRQLINTTAGPDRIVAGDEVVRTLSAVKDALPRAGGAP